MQSRQIKSLQNARVTELRPYFNNYVVANFVMLELAGKGISTVYELLNTYGENLTSTSRVECRRILPFYLDKLMCPINTSSA